MSTARKIRWMLEDKYDRLNMYCDSKRECAKYNELFADNIKNSVLSLSEIKKGQLYYKFNYGKRVCGIWHLFYKMYSGEFDHRYFTVKLMPKLYHFYNNVELIKTFEDKNFRATVAEMASVEIPRVLLKRSRGTYFDADNNIIDEEEAKSILASEDEYTIVSAVDERRLPPTRIDEFENFIVQKIPETYKCLSDVCPSEMVKFNVTTYRLDGKIYHVPGVVSLGLNSNEELNVSIDDSGSFGQYGFVENDFTKKIIVHPDSNVVLNNYKIKEYTEIIKAAEKIHETVPQLGIITWQFMLSKEGRPLLIDSTATDFYNLHLSQLLHGQAAFGDNTAEILKWISVMEKTLRKDREPELRL